MYGNIEKRLKLKADNIPYHIKGKDKLFSNVVVHWATTITNEVPSCEN